MYKIFYVIKHNTDIIVSLNPDDYPELYRLWTKTSVLKHLYAIMQHMLTYSSPLWPAYSKQYFLFSERHLVEWSIDYGISGDLTTWQSHKIFLLHAGLIKTFTVIGNQTDPILQQIWNKAVSNEHHSETLWTVPFYTTQVLNRAERIAKEYRENHVNLTHIRKNVIHRVWGIQTANSLYRSSRHVISADEKYVEHCLIESVKNNMAHKGFTTVDEIYSSGLELCMKNGNNPEKKTEYKRIMKMLLEQKRFFFSKFGYEYHPIRKKDNCYQIPTGYRGYIITSM